MSYFDPAFKKCIVLEEMFVHKSQETSSKRDLFFLVGVFFLVGARVIFV